MVSRIYLIRHGITEGNQRRWFYGKADIPLAEEGKETLQRLAARGIYPRIPDDADCYTTGLLRTEQTFEILFGDREHKVIPKLREMEFGDYECQTYEELKDYELFDQWCYDETGDAKLPGGESNNEFYARIAEGLKELQGYHRLKELSHRHSGKDAISVIVCHGGVISAMMQALFPEVNGNMWDWIPDPGFGYMIEFDKGEAIMYEKIEDIKKLGFGLMRLPMNDEEVDIEQTKEMVDLFLSKGFTYFDTAYGYLDGKSEEAAKIALVDRHPRDSFQLATKLPAWAAATETEAKEMFETSLRRTGAGYFDFFLLHNLGDTRTAAFDEFHIWDFLAEKKAEGKIVNLGFSMHDKAEKLEEILQEHPEMDFVQLQINYADWESPTVEARKCYEVARKYHKPVVIMEPIKGGSLAVLPEKISKIFKEADADASLSSWALRYVASLEGVLTVLSGMSSLEQMKNNLATMEDFEPLNEKEQAVIEKAAAALDAMPQVPCTACRYCEKGCPQQIAIPGIFRALNNYMIYGNKEGAEGNYEWETREGGVASKCIECGSCEDVCPQHIKIIKELKKAKEMFE